jgi:hypothetical protein
MDRLRVEVARLLDEIPIDFGGGCSADKAYMMGYLIRRFGMKTTVDIGVYRGRSFFPQALAHSMYTRGMVYGVDPYDAAEALEQQNEPLKERIRDFVEETDFQALYAEVVSRREQLSLSGHSILLRKTAADAIHYFKEHDVRFDLIHIDGNHDTEKVMEDVRLYLPRLRRKGFVIMDDISWESVKPALSLLEKRTFKVFQRVGPGDDYAIYWDNGSSFERMWLRAVLSRAG